MAIRPWRVWVTRSQPGAAATAAAVRARGHRPWIAPLIETRPLPAPAVDLVGVAALAFTSAAGVRAFAALSADRSQPVFAVGRATAAAAREAGYDRVEHADGDAADLADLLAMRSLQGRVLAPGARTPAFDLPAALRARGCGSLAFPVYDTHAIPPPPALRADLSAGRIDVVLLQSASAGRALEAVVAEACAGSAPVLLALSRACVPPACAWPSRVASAPRERDLLALLPPLDTPLPAR